MAVLKLLSTANKPENPHFSLPVRDVTSLKVNKRPETHTYESFLGLLQTEELALSEVHTVT